MMDDEVDTWLARLSGSLSADGRVLIKKTPGNQLNWMYRFPKKTWQQVRPDLALGSGTMEAFVHAGGTLARKELATGEVLKEDTGCIVGFTKDIDYDIEFVGGIKNTIFGGEGVFFATLRGPGVAYIQSLPFSRLADRIIQSAPQMGGKDKGEGSLLGGLGRMIDGDNRF